MSLSRRRFLEILGTAGVTLTAGDWLFHQLQAYADERLAFQDVRGPGITSFSHGVCRDCPNHCSIAVRKVDGLPVGVRGTPWDPAGEGALCVAGLSKIQALFDPDRLRQPILRDDANAPGRNAEWPEAWELLGSRIEAAVRGTPRQQIAIVDGRTPSLGTMLLAAWADSLPNIHYIHLRIETALDRLIRDFSGHEGPGRTRLDLAQTGALLLVGHELLDVDGSPVSQMRLHGDKRESLAHADAPTIYLGPRQSPTGVQANLWLPCQPGQERTILLALAEFASRNHPRREEIFPRYARWIAEARNPVDFARNFGIEAISRNTGIAADELERVARALLRFAPSVTLPGPGVLRRTDGYADARAALALNLWTGGFQEEGGLRWEPDPLAGVAAELGIPVISPSDPAALENILQPLLEIKRSPVDALICIDANLVHELPGRDQVARALSHIPFVASFSTHEDETSKLAHVTLPLPADLESWDLPASPWGTATKSLSIQRPAIVPVIDAHPPEDFFLELAAKGLGPKGVRPPAATMQALVAAAADVLARDPRGSITGEEGRFPLKNQRPEATAKGLLAGEILWIASGSATGSPAPQGNPSPRIRGDALPPPPPELAPKQLWLVPFDLAAGQRGKLLNRPMLLELAGMLHGTPCESWLEIHPDDAGQRNISSGDEIKIRGPRGEIRSIAVVTRTVRRLVVAAPVGFGHTALGHIAAGRGVNPLELTLARTDTVTGAPAWGPIPVFVERA